MMKFANKVFKGVNSYTKSYGMFTITTRSFNIMNGQMKVSQEEVSYLIAYLNRISINIITIQIITYKYEFKSKSYSKKRVTKKFKK